MDIIDIYGLAQLQRVLDITDRVSIVFFYGDDSKSSHLDTLFKQVAQQDLFMDVALLRVKLNRLPKEFYQRRAITGSPTVCYYIGSQEYGRTTGRQTIEMISRAVAKHKVTLVNAA